MSEFKTATNFLGEVGLLPFGIKTKCQWPISTDDTRHHKFCQEDRAFPKSPYCQAHRDMAYKIEIKDERTE